MSPKQNDENIKNRKAHAHLLKIARKTSPTLHQLLKQAGAAPMPPRRTGGLVSVLARAIVGQQVAAKVAATFWLRLQDQAKKSGLPLTAFLCPANQKKIRQCGVSNNKVRFLIGLGEAHQNGFLSARRVTAMDHNARLDYLTQLDGIGPWTCDMIGIFYCRDPDIWPQGDLAVRNTFARITGTDENKARENTETFAPWRSHLALHMWREKNNPMV